ncbi:hypothetical protein ECANGB1_1757 [Enterospora canceri]|uniref:Uncharacterized protein n=1 Tax=Enterospora canceri TaxID=1081671 RepID=A0A1Y1S676_9MICR|nr:hypothetical protein ECANGB1_1757 [Enterospora canceri]
MFNNFLVLLNVIYAPPKKKHTGNKGGNRARSTSLSITNQTDANKDGQATQRSSSVPTSLLASGNAQSDQEGRYSSFDTDSSDDDEPCSKESYKYAMPYTSQGAMSDPCPMDTETNGRQTTSKNTAGNAQTAPNKRGGTVFPENNNR